MAEKSGLDKLCSQDKLIRSNYFSETYRAELKVGDELGTWDIIHVSLPFSPLKEREAMVRFGLTKTQMLQFYKQFGRCVKNDIKITNFLSDSEVKSVVKYASYVIERKEETTGSDIYLVTRPMDMFTDKMHWNSGDETDNYEVLAFFARMLQISKGISAVQAHFGILDMDTVFMMEEDNKELVTLGGFMYGAQDSDTHVELPMAYPAHACPSIQEGKAPSLGSDVYSICSLIWTMLDGNHYTTAPDLSHDPKYAPEELMPVMKSAMKCYQEGTAEHDNEDTIVRDLTKTVRGLMKSINNGSVQKQTIIVGDPTFDISEAHRLYRQDPISATQEESNRLRREEEERQRQKEMEEAAEAQKNGDASIEEATETSPDSQTDEGEQEAALATNSEVAEEDESAQEFEVAEEEEVFFAEPDDEEDLSVQQEETPSVEEKSQEEPPVQETPQQQKESEFMNPEETTKQEAAVQEEAHAKKEPSPEFWNAVISSAKNSTPADTANINSQTVPVQKKSTVPTGTPAPKKKLVSDFAAGAAAGAAGVAAGKSAVSMMGSMDAFQFKPKSSAAPLTDFGMPKKQVHEQEAHEAVEESKPVEEPVITEEPAVAEEAPVAEPIQEEKPAVEEDSPVGSESNEADTEDDMLEDIPVEEETTFEEAEQENLTPSGEEAPFDMEQDEESAQAEEAEAETPVEEVKAVEDKPSEPVQEKPQEPVKSAAELRKEKAAAKKAEKAKKQEDAKRAKEQKRKEKADAKQQAAAVKEDAKQQAAAEKAARKEQSRKEKQAILEEEKQAKEELKEEAAQEKRGKREKEKTSSSKPSRAVPILITVILVLVVFIFTYFYLYPEILKPVFMQHFVNEYMRILNEAAKTTAQAATAIQ